MASTFVMMTAVPFYIARQQSLNKIVYRNMKAKINKSGEKEETQTKPLKKSLRDVPIQEKMHMRKLKNRISAQVSRNRIEFQKDLLNQKLADLNYEKMKLLLENEALEKQNTELEKENEYLKLRIQNIDNHSESEESSEMEVSVKHASFVNVPLQKEWVLSNIFFTLVIHSSFNAGVTENEFLDSMFDPSTELEQFHTNTTPFCLPPMESDNTPLQLSSEFHGTQRLISDINDNTVKTHQNHPAVDSKDIHETLTNCIALGEDFESMKCFLELDNSHLQSIVENIDVDGLLCTKYSAVSENSVSVRDNEMNQSTQLQLPPEWSFDNLYEDIICDSSFYSL